MRSLTQGGAKELLLVRGVPVVYHVLRECAASGMDEVLVVVSPDKEAVLRECVAPVAGTAGFPRTIAFAVQHEARGLADAIRLGRDFTADGPVAVALPDNLFVSEVPALAQVVETYMYAQCNVVAMVEILAEEAVRRGATAAYAGWHEGDVFHITCIPDKGARTETFNTGGAASAFTGVGRYVFLPEVFEVIDLVEQTLPPDAELDDIPVMQHLLRHGRLVGRRIRGSFLDVGLPSGYTEANTFGRPPTVP
jgi:UTP-glucose-1-phosphate uridylyltransferase